MHTHSLTLLQNCYIATLPHYAGTIHCTCTLTLLQDCHTTTLHTARGSYQDCHAHSHCDRIATLYAVRHMDCTRNAMHTHSLTLLQDCHTSISQRYTAHAHSHTQCFMIATLEHYTAHAHLHTRTARTIGLPCTLALKQIKFTFILLQNCHTRTTQSHTHTSTLALITGRDVYI